MKYPFAVSLVVLSLSCSPKRPYLTHEESIEDDTGSLTPLGFGCTQVGTNGAKASVGAGSDRYAYSITIQGEGSGVAVVLESGLDRVDYLFEDEWLEAEVSRDVSLRLDATSRLRVRFAGATDCTLKSSTE